MFLVFDKKDIYVTSVTEDIDEERKDEYYTIEVSNSTVPVSIGSPIPTPDKTGVVYKGPRPSSFHTPNLQQGIWEITPEGLRLRQKQRADIASNGIDTLYEQLLAPFNSRFIEYKTKEDQARRYLDNKKLNPGMHVEYYATLKAISPEKSAGIIIRAAVKTKNIIDRLICKRLEKSYLYSSIEYDKVDIKAAEIKEEMIVIANELKD